VYNVAYVHNDKCVAEKGCRLCIMYCPEADCIMLNAETMKAEVVIPRCKGCDLCKVVTPSPCIRLIRSPVRSLWMQKRPRPRAWAKPIPDKLLHESFNPWREPWVIFFSIEN
jgi:Pyruvate/2-oxoacid:ferredoxin oxidoreductase delta subunit